MPAEFTAKTVAHPCPNPDEGAFSAFYDRVAPGLRGIAARILLSTVLEEQAVENAFLRFWNGPGRLGKLDGREEAKLVLAMRNAAVERLRSQRDLPPAHEHRAAVRRAQEECLPTSQQVDRMSGRRDLVTRVLNQLPAPQRKVLDLVLFEGYSEQELVRVLNEPLGRIKDQVRASLAFVRQRLRTLRGTWTADI